MRAAPRKDIRPGLAHNELVHADDYARFARLKTIACLSFQWAAPTPELAAFEKKCSVMNVLSNLNPSICRCWRGCCIW